MGSGFNGAKTINLGKITYNLNGGTYKYNSTTERGTYGPVYFTQSNLNASVNDGIAYWNGKGYDSDDSNALQKIEADPLGGENIKYRFKGWSRTFDSGILAYDVDAATPEMYKGFDNLTVYAVFEENGTTGEAPTLLHKFLAKWIKYTINGEAPETSITATSIVESETATIGALSIEKSGITGGSLRFAVNIPEGTIFTASRTITLDVSDSNGNIISSSSNVTSTTNPAIFGANVSSWEVGAYVFTFTATPANPSVDYKVNFILNLIKES